LEYEQQLKEQNESEGGEQQKEETELNTEKPNEEGKISEAAPKLEETDNTEADENDVVKRGGEALEKILEEDESRDGAHLLGGTKKEHTQSKASIGNANNQSQSSLATLTSVEPGTTVPSLIPRKGPETQEFLDSIKKTGDSLKSLQAQVISLTGSDPAFIDINKTASGNEGLFNF